MAIPIISFVRGISYSRELFKSDQGEVCQSGKIQKQGDDFLSYPNTDFNSFLFSCDPLISRSDQNLYSGDSFTLCIPQMLA